jgi:4-hydroxybenzoate polyprenyltransferase
VPLLIVLSAVFAAQATASFCIVLFVYFVATLLYSLFIKSLLLLDVVCLALLYVSRIVGGHEATGIAYSSWLLAFALFIFFSLALVKRYSELYAIGDRQVPGPHGRGYFVGDKEQVSMLGTSSGLIAVLVLALYVNSTVVQSLYHSPLLLLLLCPILLYWIGRIWVLAHRGQMHEDPILFALHDRVSYIVIALAVAVMVIATHF